MMDKPDHLARTALVLYGSETGNAQDLAEEMGRMVERLHFSSHVVPMDSVEPAALVKYTVVLSAVSTAGQGGLPVNSRGFWKKLLRKKLPPTYLEQIRFATFGLGDSSYLTYNWAALKLHKRFLQLGARELVEKGEGDDQHAEGYDASFLPWLQKLRLRLLQIFPLECDITPIPDGVLLQPPWLLGVPNRQTATESMTEQLDTTVRHLAATSPLAPAVDLNVVLTENRRVTPESHWQDVRHLVFTSEVETPYLPGDVLTIYPRNALEDVDQIIALMEWEDAADMQVCFERNPAVKTQYAPSVSLPLLARIDEGITLKVVLRDHLDLNVIPRRSFFSFIAHFTSDQFQKDRLLEFANPELIDELYDYTTRPRRSILEVFQEFGTVRIPWQWAAVVLPELRGRQFSIASGGGLRCIQGNMTRFELLVAIVKYRTVIKKIRRGVCTRYLEGLKGGTSVRVSLQKGGLGLTEADLVRPILMVGPGTGVAAMRSLIWERYRHQEAHKSKSSVNGMATNSHAAIGESVLFFGCRNEDADYFFRDEWADFQSKMPLQVFTAFSRDQQQKVYVQDQIRDQRQLVYRLLHDANGAVLICGASGKMPLAVREALIEAFVAEGPMDRGAAEAYLASMEKQGRYKQETW